MIFSLVFAAAASDPFSPLARYSTAHAQYNTATRLVTYEFEKHGSSYNITRNCSTELLECEIELTLPTKLTGLRQRKGKELVTVSQLMDVCD